MTADEIIAALNLRAHPEGGWFRETWRADTKDGERASDTAIYYLLKAGERSHWHRVDATEIWHYHAGAPLKLSISPDGKAQEDLILGPDLSNGEAPQWIVPPHAWQAAQSLGDFTLVGCTVSPAFEFSGFEMAPKDWTPES
ncbi:cupin domain-containing protein [Marinicaulis aureus]|uniref:Cupin domain-containing protein n=1 Tax=Hyphococcus aureus TaxID=2666033 RepID=A0ABW1KSU2_9PROT